MESIPIALKLTAYGLGGTFLALILLYAVILVTRNLFRQATDKKSEDTERE